MSDVGLSHKRAGEKEDALDMANESKMSDRPFRWRTLIEVAVIAAAIYIAIGAPGLFTASTTSDQVQKDVPIARAKAETLVYPSKGLQCPRRDFGIHILSSSPLVIYIDDFLSDSEADHLVDIRQVNIL